MSRTSIRADRRTARRRCATFLLSMWCAWFGAAAQAQLRLEITQGVEDAVPVAVVPMGGDPSDPASDVASIVAADLQRSGRFAPIPRSDMVDRPQSGAEIRYADWRLLKADFIVVGRVNAESDTAAVSFELHNVVTGQPLLAETLTAPRSALRTTAHRAADRIYEKLTGVRGAFATRIAYVAVEGKAPALRSKLIVADADGYGPRTVADSPEPLMSPAWSPDGQLLAYVSFEGKASAIYVQKIATGERRRVSARSGINGAPAWSPDGRRLALTLSRNGNLDIYTLQLATQTLTRVTSDEAIDTEPEWSRDGKSIYFTSDRAGGPQIYRVDLDEAKRAERVTFEGSYNARPRLSPDGTQLAMVTLDRGAYRIATLDLNTRALRVLSNSRQEESPSYAPNGVTLIYGTKEGGRGSLALVSADGRYQQRLSSDRGDVREPAWSPYATQP